MTERERKPDLVEVHLIVDIGPHLSHLLKRLFPKSQQAEVDALTKDLAESASSLDTAVDANTPHE